MSNSNLQTQLCFNLATDLFYCTYAVAYFGNSDVYQLTLQVQENDSRPETTDMVMSNIRFTWPSFEVAYESTQSDIAWGSKMTDPEVDEDSVDVWSSLGADYNYFDKTVMKAGF